MREILIAALAAASQPQPSQVPAAAPQAAQVPATPAAQAQPVDAARLAAARRLVDLSWPREAFVQAMERGFAADLAAGAASEASALDPHHEERSRLTLQAVQREMLAGIEAIAPEMSEILAHYFARALSVEEIEQANAFYARPSAQAIVATMFTAVADPAYMALFSEVEVEAADRQNAMMRDFADRFIAATAHLPPLPGLKEGFALGTEEEADRAETSRPASAPALAPVDPARLAAARRLSDLVHPEGQRTPTLPLEPAAEIIAGVRVGTLGIPLPPDLAVPADATLGDMLEMLDPHYLERARIALRLFGEALPRMMDLESPGYRRATAEMYARALTTPQLDELATFYESPAGRAVMRESNEALGDPEFIQAFLAMIPRGLAAFYPAMERVNRATAHLPPPPVPDAEEVEDAVRNDI